MELEKLREEIRAYDRELADIFIRRMEAVRRIADYKKAHGLDITNIDQEQSVIENATAQIEDEELRSFFVPFVKSALDISKKWQGHLMAGQRIAYCSGMDPKDYSVAGSLFPGRTRVGYPNYRDTYEAVVNGECDVCVIPFEKSGSGEIGQVLDIMLDGDLFINKAVTVDNGSSTVRYAVMSRVENGTMTEGADNRFMMMFTVKDEAGALASAINCLSSYGYNMSILRSRHVQDHPWDYYFYAEAEGDITTEDGSKMLEDMRSVCQSVKSLGCYEVV